MQNWDVVFPTKAKNSVGRPVENPFPSLASEEEFGLYGEAMLKRYFRPAPNSKKDFVFDEGHKMSKTLFWTLVFIYFVNQKGLDNNLQGFISAIQAKFGSTVASDRTGINRCVCMLRGLHVGKDIYDAIIRESEVPAREKYQSFYRYVVKRWEHVLCSSE